MSVPQKPPLTLSARSRIAFRTAHLGMTCPPPGSYGKKEILLGFENGSHCTDKFLPLLEGLDLGNMELTMHLMNF